MIVGRIWGGLGNQLFQYAYLYAIKQKTKQELKLDNSFFKNQKLRSYRLDLLNIRYAETISEDSIPQSIQILKKKWINRLIRIIPLYWIKLKYNWKYYKEIRFKYLKYAVNPHGHNIYFDGYWQTEKYFKKFENEIREQFTPRYVMDDEVIEKMNEVSNCCSVSVHIRRGDYLNISKLNSNLYLLSENYYKNAIKEMKNRVNNPKFYFFSDDIEWVKSVFNESNSYKYISIKTDTNDIDELMIMSKCKHHITANSSYSWWGAWLDPSKDKIVMVPSKRYGNDDIVSKGWIKISIE